MRRLEEVHYMRDRGKLPRKNFCNKSQYGGVIYGKLDSPRRLLTDEELQRAVMKYIEMGLTVRVDVNEAHVLI